MEDRYYWLKSDGGIEEIKRDKFLKLNQSNLKNPCHRLAWKTNDVIQFIHGNSGIWVDVAQVETILN